MAPGSTPHHIFSLTLLLRCTFRLQISLCNQSWRDWQPLYSVGCKLFCVCAGTLDLTRFSYWIDTLVLKLREILTAPVLHHPFLFKGKTNASSRGSKKNFWRRCRGGSSQELIQVSVANSSLAFTFLPLVFLSPTSEKQKFTKIFAFFVCLSFACVLCAFNMLASSLA